MATWEEDRPSLQERRQSAPPARSSRSSRRNRGLFVVVEGCMFYTYFYIRGFKAADPSYSYQIHAPEGVERSEAVLISRELERLYTDRRNGS